MENLLNLNYEGQGIRSFIKEDTGEVYFNLKDCCKVLGITNTSDAKNRLQHKGVVITDTLTKGGKQKLNYINEPNVYRLVFLSRKKESIKFQDWVYEEVLPSIRKTGSYSVNNNVIYNLNVDTEEWRKELVSMRRGIATNRCKKERIMYGKSISYCWSELSKNLNSNLGINIESRITRTRKRMLNNGISKTESNKFGLTRLVSQDKTLLEESSRIVFEMAGKYSYCVEETDNTNFKIILNKQLSNLELEKQKLINSKNLLN